jgi:Na+-transporting NADH:ubiquinone oxidoreductase subunit NqrF
MINSILDYMGTWPMIAQMIIVFGIFFIFIAVMVVMIYKLFKAKEIHAGPIEIESENDNEIKKDVEP